MRTFIIAIYILLNFISFGLYAYDKIAAKSGWWRISEKSLLTVSILGGCFGGTLAVYLLRHKTQHTRFILVNWIADRLPGDSAQAMKSRIPNSHSLDAPATRIGSTKNLAEFLGWSANGNTFEN